MKSKARPRDSANGEPGLCLSCIHPASPHHGKPRAHPGAVAPGSLALFSQPSHFRLCSGHRRVSQPRSTCGTVPLAASPSQPPRLQGRHRYPKTKPLCSEQHGTPWGTKRCLEIAATPVRDGQCDKRVPAHGTDGTSSAAAPSPAQHQPSMPSTTHPRSRTGRAEATGSATLVGQHSGRQRHSLQQRPCPPNQILIQTSPPEL